MRYMVSNSHLRRKTNRNWRPCDTSNVKRSGNVKTLSVRRWQLTSYSMKLVRRDLMLHQTDTLIEAMCSHVLQHASSCLQRSISGDNSLCYVSEMAFHGRPCNNLFRKSLEMLRMPHGHPDFQGAIQVFPLAYRKARNHLLPTFNQNIRHTLVTRKIACRLSGNTHCWFRKSLDSMFDDLWVNW